MGKIICREMLEHGVPFVMVEKTPEVLTSLDKTWGIQHRTVF